MMDISIRSFVISEYDAVMALWKRCEGVGLSEADAVDAMAAYLERNPGMSFVAVSGDRIVGAILCGHDGRRGYIHHLAVDADWRRQGVGRQLVGKCLSVLVEAGIQKAHLFIFADNDAGMAFWTAAGWTCRTELNVMSKIV